MIPIVPLPRRMIFGQRLPILCLLVLLGDLAPLHAQNTPENPAELSSEALLSQSTQALDALNAITDRLTGLTGTETELGGSLTENTLALESLTIPEAPEMAAVPDDPATAQALLDDWEARQQALEQRRTLLETRTQLTQQHREQTMMLAEEHDLLAAARTRLDSLLEALRAGLDAGELTAEELGEPLQAALATTPDEATVDDPAARATEWRRIARRDGVVLARTAEQLAAVDRQLAAVGDARQQATAWLQETTRRAQLREEFQAQSLAELIALLNNILGDWQAAQAQREERLAAVDELTATVVAQGQALEAMEPPSPDAIAQPDEPIESLRQAGHAVAVAEAMLAYRERQLDALREVRQSTQSLLENLTTARELTVEAFGTGLELQELARTVQAGIEAGETEQRLPDDLDPQTLDRQVDELRRRRNELAATRQQTEAALETLETRLAEAEAALGEATETLAQRETALEREAEWTAFIRDVQTLDDEALLQTFEESLAALAQAREAVAGAAAETQITGALVEESRVALERHYNPVVREMMERTGAFTEWHEEQGLRLAEDPDAVAEEAASTEAGATADGQPAAAQAADTTTTTTETPAPGPAERWLADTREQRDTVVVRRLNYYRDGKDLRLSLAVALRAHDFLLEQQRLALEEAAAAARQVWGAATTLRNRVEAGELPADRLPEAVADWDSREPVLELRDRATELTRQQSTIDEELAGLEAPVDPEYLTVPLRDWRDNLGDQIERLSDYLNLEAQFHAITDLENLGELEQRMLDRDIAFRISRDLGVYDALDDLFASQETETIDELLRRYYQRLLLLERQVANLDDRKALLEAEAALVEGTREIIVAVEDAVRRMLQVAETRLDMRTTAVKAALDPGQAPELLAALEERTGQRLDASRLPQLPTEGDEDALREARNELIQSLAPLWGETTGYRLWQQRLGAALAELGGLDTRLGEIRDLNADLDAQQMDFQRNINRLVGYSEAELQTLAEGGSLPDAERERVLKGEIGLLQSERQQVLHFRAAESLGALVLIPVAALLAILVARRAGRRLVARVTRENNDGQEASAAQRREREERAHTLLGIFQTVWTTLIIALAVIYMLKVVNIDVTPIIASLGIFGLAVAFGAQAMMRDLFGGFFLLLENQFNKGDEVTINGIRGHVEQVGLRNTLVRSRFDGQLHFISNGIIQSVGNFNKGWCKVRIEISVDQDENPDEVLAILQQTAEEMFADPAWRPKMIDIDVDNGVSNFDHAQHAMGFLITSKVLDTSFAVHREYRRRAMLALQRRGIKLALPHEVHIQGHESREPVQASMDTPDANPVPG